MFILTYFGIITTSISKYIRRFQSCYVCFIPTGIIMKSNRQIEIYSDIIYIVKKLKYLKELKYPFFI